MYYTLFNRLGLKKKDHRGANALGRSTISTVSGRCIVIYFIFHKQTVFITFRDDKLDDEGKKAARRRRKKN